MGLIQQGVTLQKVSKVSTMILRSYRSNPIVLRTVIQNQTKPAIFPISPVRVTNFHSAARNTPLSPSGAYRPHINSSLEYYRGVRLPTTILQRTLFGLGKKKEKKPGFLRKYGKVASVAYLGVSVVDYLFTLWLVRVGGEQYVKPIRETLYKWYGFLGIGKVPSENGEAEEQMRSGSLSWTSTLLIALGIHKLLTPLRIPLAAFLAPGLARKAALFGWKFLIKR
ncbi:DUF1279 superfamily [Basidiobolus ranarum]|uniref:DUF1279 superfamily n=1 Tax=Basidiobolus ranarum TaxID=34480 RepID=A0ABR2WFZ5_9FUNG